MNDIIIAEAVRSAVGRGHKGSLSNRRPDELAADVLRGLIARVPQAKGHIDDVVMGCAMPEGEQGLNVARVVGLLGNLPESAGAITVNPVSYTHLDVYKRQGVMGASTAYHLALRGCSDVVLLESQPFFGQGAKMCIRDSLDTALTGR